MALESAPVSRVRLGFVFLIAFIAALFFAFATGHVWEDFYITYKSSKNLATGNGLVFMPGERLHTFTSPLGVLLPALASVLTGNSSDATAIWLFRLWSCAAFGGAAVLVYALGARLVSGRLGAIVAAAWLALDAKSLDFAINGMETGFLQLFLAYTLWALFTEPRRKWLHLGVAWAGMMWTRPDSFLYIGVSAAAVWLFNDAGRSGRTRREWIPVFLKAGVLCTALYLPWFLWATAYYGTPVPHTITAKGNIANDVKTVWGAVSTIWRLPVDVWRGTTSLESTFLPSYFQIGGWPEFAVNAARTLALFVAYAWLLPFVRRETRALSLLFCGMHVYLSYYPFFPFPWYIPATALIAGLVLGLLAAQMADWYRSVGAAARPWHRGWAFGGAALLAALVAGEAWLTFQMARQMAVEQRWSATGARMAVGKWLRENAEPGQSVFMEPLGHIGFFSGLKTYDFPGLSSREVVRAIRVVGTDWAFIAEYLSPDWIVLRPWEIDRMNRGMARVLNESYRYVTEFNTLPEIAKHDIYGKRYVEHDARLVIFRRVAKSRFQIEAAKGLTDKFPLTNETFPAAPWMFKLHADGLVSFRTPQGATRMRIGFGLPPRTYLEEVFSDGAEFQLWVVDGTHVIHRESRILRPREILADRGLKHFEVDLPPTPDGAEVVLVSLRLGHDVMDWCCWSMPEFPGR